MNHWLITYRCERKPERANDSDRVQYCQEATKLTPVEWLEYVQQFREMYLLINVLAITEEEFNRIDGALKGM